MAIFDTEYNAAPLPLYVNAPTDEMFTMRPGRSAAMSPRATSLARSHGPRTLVSSTASVSSSDILCARWASGMPALLTRMSTRPSASFACATAWTIDSSSVTSSAIGTHVPPSRSISRASSSRRSTRRAVTATFAPAAATVRAKRYPSPELAPVTRATRPVRSFDTYGRGNDAVIARALQLRRPPPKSQRPGGRPVGRCASTSRRARRLPEPAWRCG